MSTFHPFQRALPAYDRSSHWERALLTAAVRAWADCPDYSRQEDQFRAAYHVLVRLPHMSRFRRACMRAAVDSGLSDARSLALESLRWLGEEVADLALSKLERFFKAEARSDEVDVPSEAELDELRNEIAEAEMLRLAEIVQR